MSAWRHDLACLWTVGPRGVAIADECVWRYGKRAAYGAARREVRSRRRAAVRSARALPRKRGAYAAAFTETLRLAEKRERDAAWTEWAAS